VRGGLVPIHLAVKEELVDVVELLLKAGSPVLPRDHEGRTSLHYAAAKGNMQLVELLLTAQVSGPGLTFGLCPVQQSTHIHLSNT
jgi:ankyrin repeat protein